MAQKIMRQSPAASAVLPASGARMGATLMTSINVAMSCAASGPVYRSRTTARAMTMPEAAPNPCKARAAISQPMSGANAAPTAPSR